ncbi:MAG: cell division protein FtsQ/DivIB [Rhodospirillales bacterium]|nr:cell division protein FtsQ/DivIB [Rhodospirillales bacterium]
MIFAVVAGAAGGVLWLRATDLPGRTVAAIEDFYRQVNVAAGLVIEEVLVEGRQETTRRQLLEALDVTRGDLILSFDPETAQQRLVNIGWIAEARVARRLPNTIYVEIVEREPIAIWQNKGKFVLVDPEGVVIARQGIDRFSHLKVIVGDDAPQHAPALFAMLKTQPDLMKRVAAAVWTGGRRWNLRLDNGVDVRLPEEGAKGAWDRLARYEREHQLLRRDIIAVDLRVPDRLVVRMNRERPPPQPDPGDRT